MLSDRFLKNLKPKNKAFKVSDRDGMYVFVSKAGLISFRLDYRLNGRRETVTLGKYGRDGISLLKAREACMDAKRTVREGRSPALEKQREKNHYKDTLKFGEWADHWLREAHMADSTKAMRTSILKRDILLPFKKRLLSEITGDDLRTLCLRVKDRGAPATAIHIRDIIKQIFVFANQRGQRLPNPADEVLPSSIAKSYSRDRALTPVEIRLFYHMLENINADHVLKLGLKLLLLTMKRKSEVTNARWTEVDFETAKWTIPKERMKTRSDHVVYLSRQVIDIMVALKTCSAGSEFLFPSRYDPSQTISKATFNRITKATIERAKKEELPLEHFTVHDLRRTGSTLLNELGFNSKWIDKCMAHEDNRSSHAVYNKAQYAEPRRHMMQEWADMIDAWVQGERRRPKLLPDEMSIYEADSLL
uniref:Integrase n=1 Tax=OCS116 cluster bacterium TaxID=2030921 RepID=A0A2A4Z1Y1_9PROT